ncbi:MAG: hypothetical protein HZB29_13635 [Nitrospinae bacterium]|nr:hypothetical protein [Nitrospinota bacterium]
MVKVLIMGRTEILYDTARLLLRGGKHEITGIITAKARPEYKRTESDFRKLARENGIPFLSAQKLDETAVGFIKKTGTDICVSLNWITIAGKEHINLFRFGVLNAHFGDLPRYRGNAVTNWAILMGEKNIAFIVHFMEAGEIDSGPILLKEQMRLADDTTIDDINRLAQNRVPGMFLRALDGLADGTIKPKIQPIKKVKPFRCHPRLPMDGRIEWNLSAKKIHALVRSLAKPYSGAYTYCRIADNSLRKFYVWKSRVVKERTDDIGVPGHVIKNDPYSGESWIYTGGGILALLEVSDGENGKPFAPGSMWKSTRMRLGMDVEEELFNLLSRRKK